MAAVGRDSFWSALARAAFGVEPPGTLAERVQAGLALYRETAAMLGAALRPADRPVVKHALAAIRLG